MTTQTKAPPVFKDQIGNVEVAIWANPTATGTYYTATFARRRKDPSGKWAASKSFGVSDLFNLRALVDLAFSELRKRAIADAGPDSCPTLAEGEESQAA